MRFVAFIRNVNLGQPKSPTRAQLEDAFLQAGASTATSFLSNGTLIYSVSRSRLAQNIANRACKALQQICGILADGVFQKLKTEMPALPPVRFSNGVLW